MSVYDKEKYLQEVQAVRHNSFSLSYAPIDQLQTFAQGLSEADPLPPDVQRTVFRGGARRDVLDALLVAIAGLKQGDECYSIPEILDVPAEWVTSKSANHHNLTILYVHGGGFIYGSPGTARRASKKIADLTGGRCIVPQYRKSPSNTFPAALLDIFIVYLSLLASPEPIKASNLVLVGESSGFNLILALTQVILYLRARGISSVRLYDRPVDLELPAGVGGISGFMDLTCGLPSWSAYASQDVLPELQPTYSSEWETQKLWPTEIPRADLYCEKSAMSHPLLSPVTADSWAGAPPLFIAASNAEMNRDGNLYIAQLAASQGVLVQFKLYEDMIHVWSTALPKLPHSAHVMSALTDFIKSVVSESTLLKTTAVIVPFQLSQPRPLDISRLTNLSREDVLRTTAEAQRARLVLRRKPTLRL